MKRHTGGEQFEIGATVHHKSRDDMPMKVVDIGRDTGLIFCLRTRADGEVFEHGFIPLALKLVTPSPLRPREVFAAGETVYHCHGGPPMTVADVGQYTGTVYCKWPQGSDTQTGRGFPAVVLGHAPPPPEWREAHEEIVMAAEAEAIFGSPQAEPSMRSKQPV